MSLEGIPPAPAGVPRILVSFALDQDGILSVGAVEEKSGIKCRIVITNENGASRLTQEEIDKMLQGSFFFDIASNMFLLIFHNCFQFYVDG